jgi:two-component system, NarL family, nitrate/nitrite response regulator NarL
MTEATEAIRIVIADDHPIVRDGLRKLLEGEPGFEVVGMAADGQEAVHLTLKRKPHILLLDLAMPRMAGFDVLRELQQQKAFQVRPVVLTAGIEQGRTLEALKLGARGIVLKESATELLFKAIRCVMGGEYWIGREGVHSLIAALTQPEVRPEPATPPAPAYRITPRERDIVAAIVAGLSNKEIAQRYSLSEQTVKHHLSNVFDKLGVSTRLELALLAVEHRLVERD